MKNIREYKGIINEFTNTDDFFRDYTYMSRSLVYKVSPDKEDSKVETGLLLANTNETQYLKIKIPSPAYLHLMSYSNPALPPIPSHTGLLNIITNFFGIEVICGYMTDFDGIGDCTISLVLSSNDKIFSVDAYVHDVVALTMVKMFPVFIKRDLYKQHGIDKEELKGYGT